MSYTDFLIQQLEKIKDKDKVDKRKLLLKIINLSPGIRYRELLRITNLNNGTLSHHLTTLEKSSIIKVSDQNIVILPAIILHPFQMKKQ